VLQNFENKVIGVAVVTQVINIVSPEKHFFNRIFSLKLSSISKISIQFLNQFIGKFVTKTNFR
jgi:hypothetical protein